MFLFTVSVHNRLTVEPESMSSSASDGEDSASSSHDSQSGVPGKRKRDPSTYGTKIFPIGELGSIVWSYGRNSISAHCINPKHNQGTAKCRMQRVATKRALGACGAFLECSLRCSTKREHMRRARQKEFSYSRRVAARAICIPCIPQSVRCDPRFERHRRDDEPEEPLEHA